MIISAGNGTRRLFQTEISAGRWAVWTGTADSPDSIRVQRIRNSWSVVPGVLWAQPTPSAGLPRGMIAFPCEHEPSLDYLRRHLPAEWSPLWEAIEAEFSAWAEGAG
ncbi:hypothetical protein [Nocardia sp. NPDC051570]|uniref:hypothetical protein n=1 Tax=Nocardia sp. NPDC051570 TaxID=3364324 RepID=UPI0037AB57E8